MKRYGLALIALCIPCVAQAGEFAQLPHHMHTCAAADLGSLLKLRDVLEKPANGPATEAFQRAPHQYLFFSATQNFVEIAGSRNYTEAKDMDDALTQAFERQHRQYVLTQSGALYFYKDGKPTDTYVCDVVGRPEQPYRQGDVLLVQNNPATGTVAVKIYMRHRFGGATPLASPAPSADMATQPPGKGKNKKKQWQGQAPRPPGNGGYGTVQPPVQQIPQLPQAPGVAPQPVVLVPNP